MAKLIITKTVRTAGDIEIIVDGQRLGVVADNGTAEFEVSAGAHQLQTKLKWMGSTGFSMVCNDALTTNLVISDNPYIHYFAVFYIVPILFYLNMSRDGVYPFSPYYLPLPIVIYYLYFFTAGSHKRMMIKKL